MFTPPLNKYRLLVVEDNPGDYALIEDYLNDNGFVGELRHSNTFQEAEEYLDEKKHTFDAILLDLNLPDKEGEELIRETVKRARKTPIIVLTGYSDMDFSVRSLGMGISDYIVKENLTPHSLWKSVRYSIERNSMFKKLKESEERYRELFENNPSPMLIWHPETRQIVDSNTEAEFKYGYGKEEFRKLMVDDIQLSKFERPLNGGNPNNVDYSHFPPRQIWRHQKKDGTIFFVEVNGHLVEYKGAVSSLMLINDVTERINLQERMIESALQAEEKERNRVARELHDGIVQQLVACGMFTQNLLDELNKPEILSEKINNLFDLLQRTTLQTRDISHNLQSAEFDVMSLNELMRQHVRQLTSTSVVKFKLKDYLPDSLEIPSKIKINIYRIFQELCANIIKHSGASEVNINTEIAGKYLCMSIKDNGMVFSPEEIESQGAGLINVNSRIFMLGGYLNYSSLNDSGMVVTVEVPIEI